jgi:hypothetical protein
MLFKNDEPLHLSKSQKDELMAVIRRFPVTLRLPDENIKPSVLRKSIKKKKQQDFNPNVFIKLKWSVKEKEGSSEYRYAESTSPVHGGGKTYLPGSITINISKQFQEKDIELVWFLWYCFPAFKGGKNSDPTTRNEIGFYLPWLEKENKISLDKKLNKAKNLIYEMAEDKIKEIAQAMFVSISEFSTLTDIQYAVINLLEKGDGKLKSEELINKFLLLVDSDATLKARSLVEKAFSNNILVFDQVKRRITFNYEGANKDQSLAIVPPRLNYKEYFADVVMSDNELRKTIEGAVYATKKE